MVGWVLKKIFFLVLIVAGAFYLYQTYGATFLSKNSPQTKNSPITYSAPQQRLLRIKSLSLRLSLGW